MKNFLILSLFIAVPHALFSSWAPSSQYDTRFTNSARRNSMDMRFTDSARPRRNSYEDTEIKRKMQEANNERNRLTLAIAKKFNIKDDETFTTESFRDLADKATPQRPFFLAIVAAPKGNYHFFSATELAAYMATGKRQNPINRQPVNQIMIYRYNGEEKAPFPFDYVETIQDNQMNYFERVYGSQRSRL